MLFRSEAGPPKFSGDQLASFQEAGVSGRFVIVAASEDGAAQGIVRGDVDAAFIREDARFDLPVSKLGSKGERDILVHRLESLEDEGITCEGGFNAVGEGGVDEVDKKGGWKEGDVGVVRIIRREKVRAAGEGIGSG